MVANLEHFLCHFYLMLNVDWWYAVTDKRVLVMSSHKSQPRQVCALRLGRVHRGAAYVGP